MANRPPVWHWKVEPESPGFASPDPDADFWGLNDDVTLASAKLESSPRSDVSPKREGLPKLDFSPKLEKDDCIESKSAAQLLDELDEWIAEEPFAVWLEEKIDLPLLDIPEPIHEAHPFGTSFAEDNEAAKHQAAFDTKPCLPSPQYVVPEDTESLLQEFETVFGEVENNYGLTPPQSPTHLPQPVRAGNVSPAQAQFTVFPQTSVAPIFITTLQQMLPVHTVPDCTCQLASVSPVTSVADSGTAPVITTYTDKKEDSFTHLEQIVPSPAPDVDEELAVVDELIRSRVEDLGHESEYLESTGSPYKDTTSPEQPASQPPAFELDITTNSFPETVGQAVHLTPPSPSATSNSSFESFEIREDHPSDDPDWEPEPVAEALSSGGGNKATGGRKRSAKPYARTGTEEKRMRKKEQNKNAATRYRQKKKAEVEEIVNEEKQLMDANDELQTKVTDLAREIKYLKGLMRDVFKAKGLLK